MPALNQSDLADATAQWISLQKLQNATLLLRRSFKLLEKTDSAQIAITALGYFELYVNGRRVGDRVLDPPISNHAKRAYSIIHGISDYLQVGRNCIALWLGRGWYRGYGLGEPGNLTVRGPGPLPGVLHDGPVVRIAVSLGAWQLVSDSHWRGAPGPIIETGSWRSADFGGEIYDAQREIPGWSDPDYDDSTWQPAIIIAEPSLAIVPATVEPNRVLQSFPITSFQEIKTDLYQADVGTCLTGWLDLEFEPMPAGQEAIISYSDCLEHEPFNYFGQEDRYRARGEGQELFRNRFNYHGFRWIRVQGARPLRGTAHLLGTDLTSTTSFRTSNERFNRIHALVTHTLRCLTLGGVQVDCPHRERLAYGGDGAASLLTMLTHFDCRKFYPHWLQHWRDEQRSDGGLPHTAPAPYLAGGGPIWCGFPLTAAWQHYLYYGDISILRDQYFSIGRWLAYVANYSHNGLLQRWPDLDYRQWYLGDWLPPQPVNASHADSITLINNCFLVECYDRAAAIANILKNPADAKKYQDRAAAARRRIHETFYHDGIYADGDQIDLAYPLLVNAVPTELRQEIFDNLLLTIQHTGVARLGAGLVGTGIVFELLTAEGRGDLVATMIDSDSFPGWGHMLAEGATTTRENWTHEAGSHIHNCFNQVNAWFIRGLIGLQPTMSAPAFRQFQVRPQPGATTMWAAAECRTPAGSIAIRWEQKRNFSLQLTVPQGAQAQVMLPDGSEHSLAAGQHQLTCARNTPIQNQLGKPSATEQFLPNS